MTSRICVGMCAVVLGLATGAEADIEVITPFIGDASEGYEGFIAGETGDLSIFGGDAVMSGGFVTGFSSFMGSTIVPHSGGLFAHWTAPVDFFFETPVSQFGGYIATNGGADGGLVEFFGVNDQFVASAALDVLFQPGTAPYSWNGWISSDPITHVRVTGNGVLQGFLGFDDMQVTYFVPGPGAAALLVPVFLPGRRRRASFETRRPTGC